MKRSQKRACLQSLDFWHCLPAACQALSVPRVAGQDGPLLEGTWGPQGSTAQTPSPLAAPLTLRAEERCGLGPGRRRGGGQEPGTAEAPPEQPAAAARRRQSPRPAPNTPPPFPGRKHACVLLACQRLPGSWFGLGAFTSAPSAETVAREEEVPIPGLPRRKKYEKDLSGPSVCHFVNVSWMIKLMSESPSLNC